MSKISQYAQDTSPSLTDYLIGVEASGPTTKRYVLSDLLTLFLNNIPATEGSLPFVSSGLVWSGDSYGSTRAASMTSGRIRVNTTFLAISAVTARVFTASKDTYVDVLDNLDGTGTLVYTEVSNNAASPALASNSTRIAIIVTGASSIANAGSVNQGEENKVLPIASSVAYAVTDSLGNLICPRDPNKILLGYREITANVNAAALAQITGLSMPIIVPTGRKVALIMQPSAWLSDTNAVVPQISIWDGTVSSGTELQHGGWSTAAANQRFSGAISTIETLSAGLHTINVGGQSVGGGTASVVAASTNPSSIRAELR